MRNVDILSQGTVFRDRYLYSSHPHMAVLGDGELLVVFNQTRRSKFIFHPPHDPQYRNLITRSPDGGVHWSPPEAVPDYRFSGVECASLAVLRSGDVLLNQWRNRWYPLGLARAARPEDPLHFPAEFAAELIESGELTTGDEISPSPEEFAPWARGHGDCWVHASFDGGRAFTRSSIVDTRPFHGGYGMRGVLELPDGDLLLVLNDIPEFRTIFTVRSSDNGCSWKEPQLVAFKDKHLFTEAALTLLPSDEILAMMRDDHTRIMHSCRSTDGGGSWSDALPNGIAGYPPNLLTLPDGRVLCTYGSRTPEFSIRAVISEDDGRTWSNREPFRIRGHLSNGDLGYPATCSLKDGTLATVYYCQDSLGVTGVEFTRWRI